MDFPWPLFKGPNRKRQPIPSDIRHFCEREWNTVGMFKIWVLCWTERLKDFKQCYIIFLTEILNLIHWGSRIEYARSFLWSFTSPQSATSCCGRTSCNSDFTLQHSCRASWSNEMNISISYTITNMARLWNNKHITWRRQRHETKKGHLHKYGLPWLWGKREKKAFISTRHITVTDTVHANWKHIKTSPICSR